MSVRSAPLISAVLIVKNEEAVLDECLAALDWVDEIVVYDTGSTDSTREIAEKYTTHVIDGYWDDDFGGARNRALEHASGDWVLTVDADEVFSGAPARFRAALDPQVGSFMVLVDNLAGEAHQSTSVASIRVFLRGAFRWTGRLHEQVLPTSGAHDLSMTRPIPNVRLTHSGYLSARLVERDKANRNLTIAQAEVDAATAEGRSAEEIAHAKANLARSLGLHGEAAQGLAVGQEVVASGLLPANAVTVLATAMVELAVICGDDAAADAMLDVWLAHAGNPTWALSRKAIALAGRDDVPGTLDVLDRIPTTAVDARQVRFVKHELAPVEVWALMRAGRLPAAAKVALSAVRAGYFSLVPSALVEIYARSSTPLDEYVRAIPDSLWTSLALQATSDPVRSSRIFLEAMNACRPGDPTVLTCVSVLAKVFSLEEAATWAVELRRHGMASDCPLVAISLDESADPRQRAIAAAMAVDIYSDERAAAGLERALSLIPAEQEAEVLSYLEVVAPGLVSLV